MPYIIKTDPTKITQHGSELRTVENIRITKEQPTPIQGDTVFVWYDDRSAGSRDGRLEECGVLLSVERADDNTVEISYLLCAESPAQAWYSDELDAYKTRRRDHTGEAADVRTEIANKVRLYTLDHVEEISMPAASRLVSYFSRGQ